MVDDGRTSLFWYRSKGDEQLHAPQNDSCSAGAADFCLNFLSLQADLVGSKESKGNDGINNKNSQQPPDSADAARLLDEGKLPRIEDDRIQQLRDSKYKIENADAERLEQLIMHGTAIEKRAAENILSVITDIDMRHRVLDCLADDRQRLGAAKILDLAASYKREDRRIAFPIINMLVSPQEATAECGRELIAMLSKGEASQKLVFAIARNLPEEADRVAFVHQIKSGSTTLKEFLSKLIAGTPEDVSAVRMFLQLVQYREERNRGASDYQKFFEDLLATAGGGQNAKVILMSSSDRIPVSKLCVVLSGSDKVQGSTELLGLLRSSDPGDKRLGQTIFRALDNAGSSSADLMKFAKSYLPMLVDKSEREQWKLMLSKLSEGEFSQLFSLRGAPQGKLATGPIIDKLADATQAAEGRRLLNSFFENARDKGLRRLENMPNMKLARTRVHEAIDREESVYWVLSEFARDKQDAKKFLDRLNDRRTSHTAARVISLKPDLANAVLDLYYDKRTRPAATRLMDAVNPGEDAYLSQVSLAGSCLVILEDLVSSDIEKRRTAAHLVQHLNNEETAQHTLTLLGASTASLEFPKVIAKLVDDDNNPKAIHWVPEVGNNRNRITVEKLAATGDFPRNTPSFVRLKELLENDSTREFGKAVLHNLPTKDIAYFVQQLDTRDSNGKLRSVPQITPEDAPHKDALWNFSLPLLKSSDREKVIVGARVVQLMNDNNSSGIIAQKQLAKMIGDPKQNAQISECLSKTRNSIELREILVLLGEPQSKKVAETFLCWLADEKKSDYVQKLMALVDGSHPDSAAKAFEKLVRDMRSDPQTVEKLLALAKNESQLACLASLNNAPGAKTLDRLFEWSADTEKATLASAILNLEMDESIMRPLVSMLESKQLREGALVALEMLTDKEKFPDAWKIVQATGAESPGVRRHAEAVVKALAEESSRELIQEIIRFGNSGVVVLADTLLAPERRRVGEYLVELIKDEDPRAEDYLKGLAGLCNASTDSDKQQAEEIMDLLAEPRTRPAGLRRLLNRNYR